MQRTNPYAKRWVFTWNNYPEDWKNELNDLMNIAKGVYLICEEEKAPTTNMKHIQGYLRLKSRCYRSVLARKIQCYWDIANGSEMDNIKYCTKEEEGEKLELGEPCTNECVQWMNKKNKLMDKLSELMKMPWKEFSEKYPVEAFNQREKLLIWKRDHAENKEIYDDDLSKKNYWIWGPTGTGKSRWARNQTEPENLYFKLQNKWWDSYDEGTVKVVLIEDLNPEKARMLSDHMKIWADRYWFQAEVKGASIMVNPKDWYLIITSNYSIDECFQNIQDQEAIKRRFKEVLIESRDDIFLSTKILSSNNE